MGTIHQNFVGDNNHAITANPNTTGAAYADIAARDADTGFQVTANIDKVVKVTSPLGYFVLTSVGPAVWTEFGSAHPVDTLAEVLVAGNTTGGTAIVVDTGDVITITDTPVAATSGTNKNYVDNHVATTGSITFNDGSTQSQAAAPDNTTGHIQTLTQTNLFDTSAQETAPMGITFSPSGLKMYVIGDTGKDINEYDLSTPWLTATAVFNQVSSVVLSNPSGLFLKPDGTKIFVTDINVLGIAQYSMSTPYDISTATLDANQGLSSFVISIIPESVYFKADGLRFYVLDRNGANVEQFDLTTAWEITTVTYSSINASIVATAHGISFKPDGTIFYLIQQGIDTIIEYAVDVPWDISTFRQVNTLAIVAGQIDDIFTRTDSGKFYYADTSTAEIGEYDFGIVVNGSSTFDEITATTATITTATIGTLTATTLAFDDLDVEHITFTLDKSLQDTAAVPGAMPLRADTLEFKLATDISAQVLSPRGLWMSGNGLKLYIGDNTTQTAYEYDLTVPFDSSTLVYSGNSLLTSVNFTEFLLKTDGTIAYFMTFSGGFRFYTLSTPFDLSTAGGVTTHNTGLSNTSSFSVLGNGTQSYFTENSGNTILEWEMTTEWDVTTLADTGRSFAPTEITNALSDMYISPDGRQIFLVETVTLFVYQYRLSDPTDISTATFVKTGPITAVYEEFCVSSDQTRAFGLADAANELHEYTLGLGSDGLSVFESVEAEFVDTERVRFPDDTYQLGAASPTMLEGRIAGTFFNQAFDTTTQTTQPIAVWFRRDGLKMFITGFNTDTVEDYTLSTAWDSSTASHNSTLSVFAQTTSPTGVHVSPDGLTMLVTSGAGTIPDSVLQYTMTTAFALSTASYDSIAFDVSSEDTGPLGIWFKPGGLEFYLVGSVTGALYKYTTTEAFKLTGAAYASVSFNPSEITTLQGATMREDGVLLYIVSNAATDVIFEYRLNTPWDITTAKHTGFTFDTELTVALSPVISPYLDKLYVAAQDDASINEYDVGIGAVPVGEILNVPLIGGQTASRVGVTAEEIFSASDIDDLATGGILTIATGVNLTIDLESDFIISATEFVLEGSAELRFFSINADAEWLWTGTGTFISGDAARVSFENVVLISGSTGTFANMTSGDITTQSAAIIGFDDLGSIEDGIFIPRFTGFINCTVGFDLINTRLRALDIGINNSPASGSLFSLSGPKQKSSSILNIFTEDLPVGTSLLRIDPGINNASRVSVSINEISPGLLYDTTGGSTGTFTVVADAAVGATAITSVTDSSGVARFNFTVGPTLFVHQEVVVSTFVTNTAYNGTFIITTVGVGFFEIASIPFGSTETGSFLSNSVTLTDTTTTLVDGDTLVIDTDLSTDYDGGATVYNQLTNTFQINRTFTATATGTWNTAGIDQEDPRVLAIANPGFEDSAYIAAGFVNNNSTALGAIVNNTFTDLVFGTGGSALIAGNSMARWKLIDEVNGTFEYFGPEPFSGELTYDFTSVSSGGAVEFRFKWVIDTGGGFGNMVDDVESLVDVGSTASSVSKTQALIATIGDQIKPQATRNTGTSGLTVSYASITGIG